MSETMFSWMSDIVTVAFTTVSPEASRGLQKEGDRLTAGANTFQGKMDRRWTDLDSLIFDAKRYTERHQSEGSRPGMSVEMTFTSMSDKRRCPGI